MQELREIRFNLEQDLQNYRRCLSYLEGDAPIQVLCLPKAVQTILIKNDLLRIYDLSFERLKSVKGLGEKRLNLVLGRVRTFVCGAS